MEKSREQVKLEREAKKLAKQAKKQKVKNVDDDNENKKTEDSNKKEIKPKKDEKSKKELNDKAKDSKVLKKIENTKQTLHKDDKVSDKEKNIKSDIEGITIKKQATSEKQLDQEPDQKINEQKVTEKKSAKTLTKAERRAIQEAQRASKAQQKLIKTTPAPKEEKILQRASEEKQIVKKPGKPQGSHHPKVKLFSHLYEEKLNLDNFMNIPNVHTAVIKLGVQYATKTVAGANARTRAFLEAMREVISDYENSAQQLFSRGLEAQIHECVSFLEQCRSMSVSMKNGLKAIKRQLTHLDPSLSDVEAKSVLIDVIDTYIKDQIDKAAQAISITVQEKISNGDVILTYACSSLIQHILLEAHRRKVDFRVIVVDAQPLHEGQEMLRRLVSQGIKCISVLINAVAFIMPEVTKVMLGAHALLANGYVTSRVGTAQIAMIAKAFNVSVLVCCETHKFSDRVQTDGFVYNEIGDPGDLCRKGNVNGNNSLCNWESIPNLTPLHLLYDVTPPELVTAVVTEVAILPCTSVPVILRIKPSDIMY